MLDEALIDVFKLNCVYIFPPFIDNVVTLIMIYSINKLSVLEPD
jgi:hypothetical protein